MESKSENGISSELLAAFLDGTASPQECMSIFNALPDDAELRELLRISHAVDRELGLLSQDCDVLPMTAMAATCQDETYCSLECEKYILKKHNIDFDEQELLHNAIRNGWQKSNGTALHNVGRHLEEKGLFVSRHYQASVNDIVQALGNGHEVIAAVDGGELLGDRNIEIAEDILIGQFPDHTVVVLSCDTEHDTVALFDPNSLHDQDCYTLSQFVDAWNDSRNYLVIISSDPMNQYNPKPIDVSDVILTEDLVDLREAIAENAHEVWAASRKSQGWSYGPKRDDEKLLHPDMVPYSQLPDSEKEYDRVMAMNTIKLLIKLGYDIIKRKPTSLYDILKQRIRLAHVESHCPQCGNPLYMNQSFCDNCGQSLGPVNDSEDSELI